MEVIYLANLGNEREVRVCIVNNTKEIVIGELEGDDRQGITLDRCQWTQLMGFAQNATKAMQSMQDEENSEINYMQDLGGDIYLQVHSPFRCVTVRKFVSAPYSDPLLPYPHCPAYKGKELCPTKDGISLRVLEWNRLTERLQLISNFLN